MKQHYIYIYIYMDVCVFVRWFKKIETTALDMNSWKNVFFCIELFGIEHLYSDEFFSHRRRTLDTHILIWLETALLSLFWCLLCRQILSLICISNLGNTLHSRINLVCMENTLLSKSLILQKKINPFKLYADEILFFFFFDFCNYSSKVSLPS